jgi:[ribosomal protein S5]-alanine N-acetyltransferase
MHIIFETERLIVHRYTLADEEHFFRINNDEQVMRYIRAPKNREEAGAFLRENLAFYDEHPLMGRWAMTDKTTRTCIGMFAVIPVENTTEIQIGYALLPEHWGKGYATESLMAGRQYVFDVMKLSSIYAITEARNIASQKVLLRCGFERVENLLKHDIELYYYVRTNYKLQTL